jgi:hypothetical protein
MTDVDAALVYSALVYAALHKSGLTVTVTIYHNSLIFLMTFGDPWDLP